MASLTKVIGGLLARKKNVRKQHRSRRAMKFEVLENRQLMAGDVMTYHYNGDFTAVTRTIGSPWGEIPKSETISRSI